MKIKNGMTWLLIAGLVCVISWGFSQLGSIDHNQGLAAIITAGVVLLVVLGVALWRGKL